MEAARFGEISITKSSWMTYAWSWVIELFNHTTSASDKRLFDQSEKALFYPNQKAYSVCNYAVNRLLPVAGAYQQQLIDAVIQASSVYSPEDSRYNYSEENCLIEELACRIRTVRYHTEKLREAAVSHQPASELDASVEALQRHVEQLEDMLKGS